MNGFEDKLLESCRRYVDAADGPLRGTDEANRLREIMIVRVLAIVSQEKLNAMESPSGEP